MNFQKKDQEKKKKMQKIYQKKFKIKNLQLKNLATENKELYGSVKPTEISKILNENEKIRN